MYFFDVQKEELYHFMRDHDWVSTSFVLMQNPSADILAILHLSYMLKKKKIVTVAELTQTGIKFNSTYTNTITSSLLFSVLYLSLHVCENPSTSSSNAC